MRKNVLAISLGMVLGVANALTIGGVYEGTFTKGLVDGANLTQDLDLTIEAGTRDARISIILENLTGGSTVLANQVFLNANIDTFKFKGGTYKTQNGKGFLQAKSEPVSQFKLTKKINDINLSVGQLSESNKTKVDAQLDIKGVGISVVDAAAKERFLTVDLSLFGVDILVEDQGSEKGRNNAISLHPNMDFKYSLPIDLTIVGIKIGDNTLVTQDDGIFNDISSTENGYTIVGVSAEAPTPAGILTGKVSQLKDRSTYYAELRRGVVTYKYAKEESEKGVAEVELNVSF